MAKATSKYLVGLTAAALLATTAVGLGTASAGEGRGSGQDRASRVSVRILTPRHGDNAGVAGAGWIVNLAVRYPGGKDGLRVAGFTAPQLTGPGGHGGIPPFPGVFAPGRDDRLPGLVVVVSTTTAFSGPGTNLANLFNTTGVSNRSAGSTEILDNWIVGAPGFGLDTATTLSTAVVKDLDRNGVLDDAPDVVPDADRDGRISARDLTALGLASPVRTVSFRINGSR